MKKIYQLTEEQAEELKDIQNRISGDISIGLDKCNDAHDVHEILLRIKELSERMEDILVSE